MILHSVDSVDARMFRHAEEGRFFYVGCRYSSLLDDLGKDTKRHKMITRFENRHYFSYCSVIRSVISIMLFN